MQVFRRNAAAPRLLSALLGATCVLTALPATAQRQTPARTPDLASARLPDAIQTQISIDALLPLTQSNQRIEVAVSLSTAAVGDRQGTSKADVEVEQAAFIGRLSSTLPDARVIGAVQLIANTVFVEMNASDLPKLQQDRAVTRISQTGNYERALTETTPYIGGETLHGLGVTGKGVRIAVLDSGIDYTHRSLGGAGTAQAYAAAWGTSLTDPRNTTTDGLFPTSKVIGGYDFVGDQWGSGAPLAPDPDPIDSPDETTAGGHGTHVADIIAGVNGVAPDARLYAVKVCSSVSSSCSGIALMQGMEFAVDPNGDGDPSDHADIINLSLGSNYGQPFDDDLSAAVDRATKLGTLTVASAGNGSDKPFVTGSPAAAVTALSVAQTAVPSGLVDLMRIVSPAVTPAQRGAVHQNWSIRPSNAITAPVTYTASNTLGCAPFAPGSLAGRIALVDRGDCTFSDKIRNIEAGGAVAGIIGLVDTSAPFNGAFSPGADIAIPGYMINQADANAIRSGATVTFDPANAASLAGSMVTSSSRGPMFQDLRIKPEIGAPGASVSARSGTGTLNQPFGGTSGAAPMISGAAALLKQLYPTLAPQRLKQLLITTADNDIGAPSSPASAWPDSLAPITRIGGGEVRVDKAALATAGAYGFDLKKTGTRSGGVSFGFIDVTNRATVVHRRVRVFNRSVLPAIFTVKSQHRFAEDAANGAVKIHALPLVLVPGKGHASLDVLMTIDGSKLRDNPMNAGPDGANAATLTLAEYDGYLVFEKLAGFGKSERFTLPWHVLPRKAADTQVTTGAQWNVAHDGTGDIRLLNRGIGTAQISGYSLIGISPDLPQGGRGEQQPTPDLRAVGVTTVPVSTSTCTSGYLWSFAINTWERQTLPVGVSHRVALDINGDGVDDYWLLNRDVSLNQLSDGRQLAWTVNLSTGAAQADWFAEHPTNAATIVLNTCLERVGLSAADVNARRVVGVSVYADDFYFGGPGDAIEGLKIVPFGERYVPVPERDLPPQVRGKVIVHDFGQIPGTTPELGVLIQTNTGRCQTTGNCGGATQDTEVLLVAPPGGTIEF